ncbi:hypothetical protein [Demequina litorisediminis]|uniref:Uncharacterized protein n=1 Tax=Demequina litorisediminis TaxID=1849022 RepID=A0ABQ6I8P7_9MICO|nr:hypothetical protein [Demequina litorisediminis]GMA33846.1 hypothetical protein GCM10025876_00500 [Demequina litorisediminis]
MTTPKPKPTPKPGPRPGTPSPVVLAQHATHPVKVPVVAEVTDEQVETAKGFGAIEGESVVVTIGDEKVTVGAATGDDPLAPYAKAFYELSASIERFHARLASAEPQPQGHRRLDRRALAAVGDPGRGGRRRRVAYPVRGGREGSAGDARADSGRT